MSDLLSVEDLRIQVASPRGPLEVVTGVSLVVPRSGALALVGESGSGKTLTALAVIALLPEGATTQGTIALNGRRLTGLSDRELCRVRGKEIGMVFQEPASALDAVYTVGAQIIEAIRLHQDVSRAEARRLAIEWLRKVGMPGPAERMDSYPHELSGGMRQRALIAMALVCDPALLIADEPTTALDRTMEAQVLELLSRIREEREMGLLFVSHDLAVVGEVAESVAVLYAGEIVETGPTRAVLTEPLHPYTRGLIASIPDAARRRSRARGEDAAPLSVLTGSPPVPGDFPVGCRFAPRCALRRDECERPVPLFRHGDRAVRCILHPSKDET